MINDTMLKSPEYLKQKEPLCSLTKTTVCQSQSQPLINVSSWPQISVKEIQSEETWNAQFYYRNFSMTARLFFTPSPT